MTASGSNSASTASRSTPWGWIIAIAIGAFVLWSVANPSNSGSFNGSGGSDGSNGGPQYNGYVVICADGWVSHSGGRQGACSGHGGIRGSGVNNGAINGGQGSGYTVICRDGSVSQSGGRPGACSHHGGVR